MLMRMDRSDVAQIDDFTWELPASAFPDMRVPVRFLANEALLERILLGPTADQIVQTASLPGLVGHLMVMPDVSPGKGAPVGIVAVSKYPVGPLLRQLWGATSTRGAAARLVDPALGCGGRSRQLSRCAVRGHSVRR